LDQKERQAKIAAEQEWEKHKYEMEKLEMQQKLREQGARVKSEGDKTDDETEIIAAKGLAKVPQMLYFDEEQDFMDGYLGHFE